MELKRVARQARVTFDAEFNITEWSEDLERMFGWTAEEAIGRPMYEIMPGDGERTERIRALRDVGRWDGVVVITRKDGSSIATDTHTVATRSPTGEIIGYETRTSPISDMTKRIEELEAEVERCRVLLQRQMRIGEGLELESGVNERLEPFVTLRWGDMAGQLTFEEARNHANRMYDLAHVARTDAVVVRVLHELGMGDVTSDVLTAIRRDREEEMP